MRKYLTALLLHLILSFPILGQEVSSKMLDFVKRANDKSSHITVNLQGKFIKSIYGEPYIENALIGAIFQRDNGDLFRLSFAAENGQKMKVYINGHESIEVKASGDKEFFERIPFKSTSTKEIEKEIGQKIKGMGYLLQVKKGHDSLELYQRANQSKRTPENQNFETIIGAKIIDRVKLKGREYLILLKNGDSLIAKSNIANNEEYFESEYVTYIRPKKTEKEGYVFKSRNTWNMAYGMIITNQYGSSIMPSYGRVSMFLDQRLGVASDLLPDNLGFISFLETNSKDEKIMYRFNEIDAKLVQSFLAKHEEKELSFYYRNKTSNGYVKSEYYNFLYAICSQEDTLRLQGFANSSENYSLDDSQEISGTITNLNFERIHKDEVLRGIILDDKYYIKVDSKMAISISELLSKNKNIKIEGWKRKELDTEINQLGYSIYIPSKITIDGKTFTNKVNLANSL
jgi:hypothetical protein